MSATESTSRAKGTPGAKPYVVPKVSMRDLLAAGAAARAVSTPPRVPDDVPVRRPKAA